ncbi:universal stress protein [Actinomadura viridis]|uniref:Nucleotide-binding universal stress UspA family protein n=1 Tax=Actinomadura viridis TaxID=58110 RepID=A0A931DRT1_9ACTN|nr:universal stress protein [Actinomadura viridis]MBG6093579.1 nucleotide-binding universal stress UspA family protein [Actinomadura viridis]
MTEIVVGVDGSEGGLVAAEWAAAEAVLRDVPLRVVYAVAPWLFDVPVDPRIGSVREWMHKNAEEVVQEAVNRARARFHALGVHEARVSGGQVGGQPAAVLIKEAEGAAMVVVGSHGAGGLSGLLMGSVALQVVSHAPCPAVAVRVDRARAEATPPADREADRDATTETTADAGADAGSEAAGSREDEAGEPAAKPWRRMRRVPEHGEHGEIVVGVDGSEGSAAALAFAFEEAALRDARLRVVLAWTHPEPAGPGGVEPLVYDVDAVGEEQERALAEFVAGGQADFPDVPLTRQVVRARPARALAEASDRADLLVVGTRGRGGFTGLLLGSVGHALVHRARRPVAVVPPWRR